MKKKKMRIVEELEVIFHIFIPTYETVNEMSQIIYEPRPYQLELLGRNDTYVEIWRGLPRGLHFEEEESTGGEMGFVHRFKQDYIWVEPTTAKLLRRDSETFVYASRKKRPELYVRTVTALYEAPMFGPTLDSAIVWAQELNHQSVEKAIRRRQEKRE